MTACVMCQLAWSDNRRALDREIRRRTDVVGTVPSRAQAVDTVLTEEVARELTIRATWPEPGSLRGT